MSKEKIKRDKYIKIRVTTEEMEQLKLNSPKPRLAEWVRENSLSSNTNALPPAELWSLLFIVKYSAEYINMYPSAPFYTLVEYVYERMSYLEWATSVSKEEVRTLCSTKFSIESLQELIRKPDDE